MRRLPRSPQRRTLAAATAWILLGLTSAHAGDATAAATPAGEARLRADVTYLADDAREGRAPGTTGIDAAADYIGATFKEIGLKPAPGADGFFQPFALSGPASLGPDPSLSLSAAGKAVVADPKADFAPLAIGGSGGFKGLPVVFVGYGITAKDDANHLDYDDYAGLDVKGKAVLILRRAPGQDKKDGPFSGPAMFRFGTFRHKATNAFQHGAAAVLFVNDLAGLKGEPDKLLSLAEAGNDQNSTVPFAMLSRAYADSALAAAGAPTLEALEKEIGADIKPHSRALENLTLDLDVKLERKSLKTRNVVGVLEGEGPLADETIVVGGHYDHLGRGGLTSGSLAFLSRDIHNGADDNASGTALVMELARRLARRPDPLPRRVVFMAFSGEERGLLGSQHYVEHPLVPLDKTVMMINFDMVGRLNEASELTFFGIGSTPGLDTLVDALGKGAGFAVKKVAGMSDGFGGSDHQSFYQKDVPVLFAFTGTHQDYHRPTDDVERINFPGIARIADLAELILLDLARRPTRPSFTKVAPTRRAIGSNDPARSGSSAYLGSIPSYDDSTMGVKLSGVREGSPAEKGGLKGGDVVIGLGGKPIGTIYDYTESLGARKPGDEVEIKVKRDGQEVTLKVTLGKRPSE